MATGSNHAVSHAFECVPAVVRVNAIAALNGAVRGTFPGVESRVGLMWQPRLLAYGLTASGVGPSEDPEGAAKVLDIAGGRGAPPSLQAQLAVSRYSYAGSNMGYAFLPPKHSFV